MKKLGILLILVAVVGGLFFAFLYVNDIKPSELRLSDLTIENVENIKNLKHMSGAGLSAKRFLELWDKGDYDKLYKNFSSDVQQVLPAEAFVDSKPAFLIGGVLKPQIEEVKEEGGTATVQASIVNMDMKAITAEIFTKPGTKGSSAPLDRRKILIELKNEGGAWRISQFDPITEALRRMEELKKRRRMDVEASQEAEAYMSRIAISAVRAQQIHLYGPEPFIVGLVKNTGDRDVQKLGIRFTVRDGSGNVLVEDTFHPVVDSSISEEEKPLHSGEERKISYQLDKNIPGFQDTQNVSAKIIELKLAPSTAPKPSTSPEDEAKAKIKKARERERGS